MLNPRRDLTLPSTVTGSWPRPSWFTDVLHARAFKVEIPAADPRYTFSG